MFPGPQRVVVVPPHIPLLILRALLFILLRFFFPWLEWCEIWFIINAILRAIRRIRNGGIVRPAAHSSWDSDDDDDDDVSETKVEDETLSFSTFSLCGVVRRLKEKDGTYFF